jgi:membrane protein implicated in regulation of membrane protease activity
MSDRDDTDGLGGKFWLAIVGGAIAFAIAAFLVLGFIGTAWARWGFFGMFLVLSAILLGIGWFVDRREKKRYGTPD